MNGVIAGLLILFSWSISLFLCHYHTVLNMIALAIRDLLCFHKNCEIFCSSSVKNASGSLLGIALNL